MAAPASVNGRQPPMRPSLAASKPPAISSSRGWPGRDDVQLGPEVVARRGEVAAVRLGPREAELGDEQPDGQLR